MTIEEFATMLGNAEQKLTAMVANFNLQMAIETKGILLKRIFTDHKDTGGKSLGGYSKYYKKIRESHNLQSSVKDLQFTNTLRKSIITATKNEKVVLGISFGSYKDSGAQRLYKIKVPSKKYKKPNKVRKEVTIAAVSEFLEDQNKKQDIFKPSKSEIAEAKALVMKRFKDDIRKIFVAA